MNPENVKKLLGGYATGTLTSDERRILFEAALEDQELFDALAQEQALKELLEMPGARERLQEAARANSPERMPAWSAALRRPLPWAMAAAIVVAVAAIVTMVRLSGPARKPEVQMAELEKHAAAPANPPAAAQTRETAPVRKPAPMRLKRRNASPPPRPAPVAPGVGGVAGGVAGGIMATSETAPRVPAGRSFGPMSRATDSAQPNFQVSILKIPGATVFPPDAVFHSGDSIELRVLPPFDGMLYIVRSDDQGADWILAYSADVRTGVALMAPLHLGAAGETQLVIVLSRLPLVELSSQPPSRALVEQVRRDASRLSLAEPARAQSSLGGVAGPARLVREIRLQVQP